MLSSVKGVCDKDSKQVYIYIMTFFYMGTISYKYRRAQNSVMYSLYSRSQNIVPIAKRLFSDFVAKSLRNVASIIAQLENFST